MNNRKLRVGFVSNNPVGGKTGLGRNMKALLPLLHKSEKYEIFLLSQGMQDGDINFQKLPFKCEGVFKNYDQNRMNNPNEEGYRRWVYYGNAAIESFVINNKLDCLILSDDQWAYSNEAYLNTDWFKYMENNVLPIITADSLPLLPQIKEWAEKCKNMRFWTKFPLRVLNEENKDKYKNCDVIYGALHSKDFYPLQKNEKLELRRKFGIADDEKIIMYLGRNQLRKIYGSHIEGLARFKREYPDKKVKLFFHCSWAEAGGWPLNQIREQNGLKKEDILTTYYCRHCGDWNIQPYDGEDLDCQCCKAQKSRITAGINSTINEKDLNKIYNIADGSASIFTSGSFEFTNPESMLAGIPLAVPNYVCGEDFLSSGFVYEIAGTFTFEHNTGFKKFVPNISSVCDFFNYIHDMPDETRDYIKDCGRAWAIENFEAENVVKKYKEFFDSRELVDWDKFIEKKKEIKPINAPVQDHPNDIEFIKGAYKSILNMDVKDDDSGLLYWTEFLKQPKDKNQLKNELVQTFRSEGFKHNQKIQSPIPFESLLLNNGKKHFLLVCKESAGDILNATALLESLRESYNKEQWNIYFACEPQFAELLDCNPYIDKVLPYFPFMESEIQCTGQGNNKGFFDAYCFLTVNTQRHLSYLTNSNIGLVIDNKDSKTLKDCKFRWENSHFDTPFMSPSIPSFAKPLPETLDTGKKAKVINGSWMGWEGIITNHYICGDDCSGYYGQHKYQIKKSNGETFSILVADCELI